MIRRCQTHRPATHRTTTHWPSTHWPLRPAFLVCLLLTCLTASIGKVHAHDIPTDVLVQILARPQGATLQAIVRVPLKALRDVEFPARGRGYLDLDRAAPSLREAALRWLPDAIEWRLQDAQLPKPTIVALRASLQSERPYDQWPTALAHVTGPPLASSTEVPIEQVMLDTLLEWPIKPTDTDFAIRLRTERLALKVTTTLRFFHRDGPERALQLHSAQDWLELQPGIAQVLTRFGRSGIEHVLGGLDHLLFVLCLVLPMRNWRALLAVVTTFTVAHSITLIGASYGLMPPMSWFAPLVEWLIALSILCLALQNILSAQRTTPRLAVALVFGLFHGFGFSFALRDGLQLAGDHLLTALLAFNLGVELGQVAVLLVALPLFAWTLRRLPERATVIVASALIAHVAWHWLGERAEPLRQLPWWPG